MNLWEAFIDWLRSLFFKLKLELALIGFPNAGKTSLVQVIATGKYSDHDTVPTVGFNLGKVTKGGVIMKIWDLEGQEKFRKMWERYCRGRAVSVIVYVVDAAADETIIKSGKELHHLLSKPSLNGIPLLILGNKTDKPPALSKPAFTDLMRLESISEREVCCHMISCKLLENIDSVIAWLVKHAKR